MMTTFHKNYIPNRIVSFTKGAPDIIISRCNAIYLNGEIKPLTNKLREEILNINNQFSKKSLKSSSFRF